MMEEDNEELPFGPLGDGILLSIWLCYTRTSGKGIRKTGLC
jgi:hypothetical protein